MFFKNSPKAAKIINGNKANTLTTRILEIIIDKFEGGPVGLQSVAMAAGEEIETVEEVYEPYLLQIGFMARTPRGRIVTKSAYDHLGLKFKNNNQTMLL